LIAKDDVPDFDMPAESKPRDRWLTPDETNRIFAAAAEMRGEDGKLTRIERFLWLALQTAARRQAIVELTWDRVDFEVGMIHYQAPGQRETKKRRASVPISKALRPILERAYEERTSDIVIGPGGDVWNGVNRVVIRAGLGKRGPLGTIVSTGISPHTMRHTAATHMARRGVPLWVVANVLGNTMAMVERVYAKHVPGAMAAAVNMISGDEE
jgi:integrase